MCVSVFENNEMHMYTNGQASYGICAGYWDWYALEFQNVGA